ncbi:hypothetical protein Pan97_53710 [Bremerella volcania]|uniref:Carboxypeptidase regulatory-like domain-containing protein n=1 Tax=Bremerella volcania TaxID=2527984 RepID=A0A518CGD1_9BACT|nr:hypothetical protein [Bremerella volcania]QDU78286.1 hypothetical protein Pan97_53710 [Bremerella volcania]
MLNRPVESCLGLTKSAGTLLLLMSLVAAAGCGNENESIVRGKVTYQGKNLTGGTILFNPIDETQPSAHAAIHSDGSYEIKAIAGENKVIINWYSEVDPTLEPGDPGYTIPKPLIPSKYSNIDTTPLVRTVEKQETVIDFALD